MKTILVIATCPRKRSYLADTIYSIDAEGGDEFKYKLIISDGDWSFPGKPGWEIQYNDGPLGHRKAFWRTLEVVAGMDADNLLYVEDDVRACKNAFRHIARMNVPDDAALLSFHDMSICKEKAEYGPRRIPLRWNGKTKDFCGLQCALIPRRSIDFLLQHDPFGMSEEQYWSPTSSADCVLGYILNKSSTKNYVLHVPSLVLHVGEVSAAHNKPLKGRADTRNFPGLTFDALELNF